MFVVFVCLLALVPVAISSDCADQTPSCVSWAANGFCTHPFYANQRSSCPLTCGLCSAGQPLPCADKNVDSCITWVMNGFCTSQLYTTAQKIEYCAQSCGLC